MSKPIAFNYADYTDLITENDEKAIMLHVSDKVISKQKKEIESLQAQLAERDKELQHLKKKEAQHE